jgi:hypothetical protein
MSKIVSYVSDVNEDTKINGVRYTDAILRKNLPYIIEYNKITKNYYVIDRDYFYIGHKTMLLSQIDKNINMADWEKIFLFDDSTNPVHGEDKLKTYIEKYNTIRSSMNEMLNKKFTKVIKFLEY